jgi:hypothetical protein
MSCSSLHKRLLVRAAKSRPAWKFYPKKKKSKKMRAAFTTAAILLAAATGVSAQCPASLTVNGVTFDPSGLKGTLTGQQQVKDGNPQTGSYDFAVNLCSKQPECTGMSSQGLYFITQMNAGTTTCSNALFNAWKSAPAVSGNSVIASYVDSSGLRTANVQITCGGTSALSSPSNQFTTKTDTSVSPSPTTFTFTYQSSLLCGNGPTPTPSGPTPPSPPGEEKHGLTWGGVFMILFFVGLLVYALATVGFNYYKGSRGADLAPHPDFWKSLPYLFLDGVKFTWAKLLALCGKGDGSFVSSAPAGGASADSGKATSGYSAI